MSVRLSTIKHFGFWAFTRLLRLFYSCFLFCFIVQLTVINQEGYHSTEEVSGNLPVFDHLSGR